MELNLKRSSSSDIIEYLNYESTKYYKNLQHKTKKKLKKKRKKL